MKSEDKELDFTGQEWEALAAHAAKLAITPGQLIGFEMRRFLTKKSLKRVAEGRTTTGPRR